MNKKIAIPVNENGLLEGHFGHTRLFAIYNVSEGKTGAKSIETPPPHAPGVLPKWLHEKEVTDVIAGSMGERAQKILKHFNIQVHLGAPELPADDLSKGFLDNTIEFSDELCRHEHHEHHHEHHHAHHHAHRDHQAGSQQHHHHFGRNNL